MKKSWIILLALTLLLTGCQARHGDTGTPGQGTEFPEGPTGNVLDIYVSTKGSDDADGTREAPFATLARAKDAVKAQRDGLDAGNIVVHIAAGEYRAAQGVTLDATDAGTAENPIIYRGEGSATFAGGWTFTAADFIAVPEDTLPRLKEKAVDNIKCIDLAARGLTASDWGKIYASGFANTAENYDGDVKGIHAAELFCNGTRMTLARYPDEGQWLRIQKVLDTGDTCDYHGVANPQWSSLRNPRGATFTADEYSSETELPSWATYDDVWMFGYFYYDWAESTTPMASFDPETQTITTAQASRYGYRDDARYYFFNVLEGLDEPGEWYLDRTTGKLYLYADEDSADAVYTLSTLAEPMIAFDHTAYLHFENITFNTSRVDAINGTADDLLFDGCTVCNTTGNGLTLSGNRITIQNSELYHIGAAAISLSGGDFATLTPANHLVYNNHFHDWGEVQRTYQGAVNLSGVGMTVSHNEMHDAPHTAILDNGNDFVIEYNNIYRVCRETIDGGAIYSGRNLTWRGTVIRYNYLHDLKGEADGNPIAVYLDDALCGQTITNNVFENVPGTSVLIGGGRDNILTSNIFVNCESPLSYDARLNQLRTYDETITSNGPTLLASLKNVPYTSELWQERYPALASISIDDSDPANPNFFCNPAGSLIESNVVFHTGRGQPFDLHNDVIKYSTVGENPYISLDDERCAAYKTDGVSALVNLVAAGTDGVTAFTIPFNEIGRIS